MLTWYCTRRCIESLRATPEEQPSESDTILGDWYVNHIGTSAGNLFVFSNERTFASVAIPESQRHTIEDLFVARVANLLAMLGVPHGTIDLEARKMLPIQYARARDQRQLGHLQSIVVQYQAMSEDNPEGKPLSLSDAELELARMPHLGSFNSFPDKELRRLFGIERN